MGDGYLLQAPESPQIMAQQQQGFRGREKAPSPRTGTSSSSDARAVSSNNRLFQKEASVLGSWLRQAHDGFQEANAGVPRRGKGR